MIECKNKHYYTLNYINKYTKIGRVELIYLGVNGLYAFSLITFIFLPIGRTNIALALFISGVNGCIPLDMELLLLGTDMLTIF